MAYRYDPQTQGIRYFPDEEPDTGGAATGDIAPGWTPEMQTDQHGRDFTVNRFGDVTYAPARPKQPAQPVSEGGLIQEKLGAFIQTYQRAPTDQERDQIVNSVMGTKLGTTSGTAPITYGSPYVDEYGRQVQVDSRGQINVLYTPPQGRDLRMSDSEAGNLAARRDEFEYEKEAGREKMAFDREKEEATREYQNAQIELSRATLEFNQAKEEAAQKQNAIDNELKRAQLDQNAQAQTDLQAYRQEQLALDRQRIDQAERQMAEAAKQFAATDARLRRAQALAEAQAGQQAEAAYIDRFGYSPSYAGNAPGFGRITPEDVSRMTQPAFRG